MKVTLSSLRYGLLCLGLALLSPTVQAEMLVSPTRLLLQQPGETASFILRNPSNGPRTYRLEWIEREQTRNGVSSEIPEGTPTPHPQASPHLRFTPRQVTVDANSNQAVRVVFRPEGTLQPGEYRSHLLFRVLPDVSEPLSTSTISNQDDSVRLQLNMQLSIAVPVVVRYQVDTPPEVRIQQVTPIPASTNEQAAQLSVLLKHSGTISSYGRITVDLQAAPGAPVERIGQMDGVSIFPDIGERQVTLLLRDRSFAPGTFIRVAYEGTDEFQGKLWHEQVLQVR